MTKEELEKLMTVHGITYLEIIKIYEGKGDALSALAITKKDDPVKFTILQYNEEDGFSVLTVDDDLLETNISREAFLKDVK